MNHAFEALKKKMTDMKTKPAHDQGEAMEDAKGDRHEMMAEMEDKGDEIAGAAPSLDASKKAKDLGNIGALAGNIDLAKAVPDDFDNPDEDQEGAMDEADPDMNKRIMESLEGRSNGQLAQRVLADIKMKMAKKNK